MRKRFPAVVILLLAAAALWLGIRRAVPDSNDVAAWNDRGFHKPNQSGDSSAPQDVRTRGSRRSEMPPLATHSPARLREFMLPPLAIEGLTLQEATSKLMAAYQYACGKCGETALPLTFSIPPGTHRRLRVHLPTQSFRTSLRTLAALAGMKADRDGLKYRFGPLAGDGTHPRETIKVSYSFNSALDEMTGVEGNRDPFAEDPPLVARRPLAERLAALGLELDPATRVSLSADGELTVESSSAADAAAITALAGLIGSEPLIQMKFVAKVVDLQAGMEWTPPDTSRMSDAEVQLMMRGLAQIKGVDLTTMPSVTGKSGQAAVVEMVREFIYPTNDAGDAFETRNVGRVMKIQGGQLGFGQEVDFNYNDTTFEGFDPADARKPIFNERVNVSDGGFSNDGDTRFSVQTRPDGSKTLVLMTSQQIDATGRPIRGN